MAKLTSFTVGISGPVRILGTWKPDETEKLASWEMYVELITRVAVQDFTEYSMLRLAFDSLYSLFNITRTILKKAGPSSSIPKDDGTISFGYLSVTILNQILRPFLTKWHPLLLDWEYTKEVGKSPLKHEKDWEYYTQVIDEMCKIRETLNSYSRLLAEVAGIEPAY